MALNIFYAKVAQLVEAGKTLIFICIEKYSVCKYKQEKSYGIVNPRVVGSNPTLGAVAFMPRSK